MINSARLLGAMVLLAVFLPPFATPARILGVFPHIGRSHFFVFEPFMKALAAHGHEVHVISHFPQDKPLVNYTDISVAGTVKEVDSVGGISFDLVKSMGALAAASWLGVLGEITCENVLSHPSVQALLNSDEKFDLIIAELFNTDCFLGFAHKFQAPHIALSSCSLMPWSNERFGNPDNPSYIPTNMMPMSDRMSFVERAGNTMFNFFTRTVYDLKYFRNTQQILVKYFGPDVPPVQDLVENTSMIFTNSHFTTNRPRPFVPAVVEVGGIHVAPAKKLPQDLDEWLSGATHGVVYFSMGSMLRASTMPPHVRSAFLEAFRELPQRVLWKYEAESLPGQPENVRIGKWLPQRDILNHPNVRVFVSHCGLLGTIEGVMSGVPMVGIPMFGDQPTNFKSLETTGAAITLDYSEITKETVLAVLQTVLNNPSYAANAKRLSAQYLDRPLPPMETAIFWTDYVIRHNGAHHLRSAAVQLAWYQYLLLDVALALVGVLVLIVLASVIVVKKIFKIFKKKSTENSKKQQ